MHLDFLTCSSFSNKIIRAIFGLTIPASMATTLRGRIDWQNVTFQTSELQLSYEFTINSPRDHVPDYLLADRRKGVMTGITGKGKRQPEKGRKKLCQCALARRGSALTYHRLLASHLREVSFACKARTVETLALAVIRTISMAASKIWLAGIAGLYLNVMYATRGLRQ